MSYLPSLPDGSLLDAFQAQPELAHSIHEFAHILMRGSSPFTEGERELIAAFVSTLTARTKCRYCPSGWQGISREESSPSGQMTFSGTRPATKCLTPAPTGMRAISACCANEITETSLLAELAM